MGTLTKQEREWILSDIAGKIVDHITELCEVMEDKANTISISSLSLLFATAFEKEGLEYASIKFMMCAMALEKACHLPKLELT